MILNDFLYSKSGFIRFEGPPTPAPNRPLKAPRATWVAGSPQKLPSHLVPAVVVVDDGDCPYGGGVAHVMDDSHQLGLAQVLREERQGRHLEGVDEAQGSDVINVKVHVGVEDDGDGGEGGGEEQGGEEEEVEAGAHGEEAGDWSTG